MQYISTLNVENWMFSYFPDVSAAYEQLWIFGDNFVSESSDFLRRLFRMKSNTSEVPAPKSYIANNFEVSVFANSANKTHMRSTLGRLRNLIMAAIKIKELLPKYIIIIIENDLIRCVKYRKPGIFDIFGRILRWLADEFHQAVMDWKSALPSRAKRNLYPQIFWTALPYHQNFKTTCINRHKFNQCLDTVANMHNEMKMLRIRRIWSNADSSVTPAEVITLEGVERYWRGIDEAIEFWEIGRQKNKQFGSGREFIQHMHEMHCEAMDEPSRKKMRPLSQSNNKFHWFKKKIGRQRCLPKPY